MYKKHSGQGCFYVFFRSGKPFQKPKRNIFVNLGLLLQSKWKKYLLLASGMACQGEPTHQCNLLQKAFRTASTAAFLKGVKNRDRLAEPYRPNLNDSANEERSSSGSLLT